MTFNRPCLKCGTLTRNTRGYCDPHLPVKVESPQRRAKKQHLYGGGYHAKAKLIRENSTHCYLCGKPFTEGEPIQADHLYPQQGSQSPLGAAHPHCNRNKGNQPYPGPTPQQTL